MPPPPSEIAEATEKTARLMAKCLLTWAGSFDHAHELLLEAAGIIPPLEPKNTQTK
jgi:hypothetical protein